VFELKDKSELEKRGPPTVQFFEGSKAYTAKKKKVGGDGGADQPGSKGYR